MASSFLPPQFSSPPPLLPPPPPPPSFPTFTTAMAGKFTSLVGNYGVNSTLSQNYVRFSKNFSPGDIARYIVYSKEDTGNYVHYY